MRMALILFGILIVIGVGYYTLSPLFDNSVINDEIPELALPEPIEFEEGTPDSITMDHLSEDEMKDMISQLEEANEEDPVVMDEDMPGDEVETVDSIEAGEAHESGPTEIQPAEGIAPGPAIRGPFAIKDTPLHPASGDVKVIDTVDGTIVRFEDFKTINGPRVHVYLATDLSGRDFIDLGPIRGTEGNINYTVPEGIDIDDYPVVMHWCVPFGVLFNYAEIQ